MFAETESEELLNLLSQVRLVADEEARTDHEQQQQQLFHAAYAHPLSPPSVLSMSTASAADTTANIANTLSSPGKAFSPTNAGRYTALSTAAVSWTVHDSSSSAMQLQRDNTSSIKNNSVDGEDPQNFFDEAAIRKTPVTGVKVLQVRQGGGNSFEEEEDVYGALQQPKQLFFVDAHKRSALRQQQAQRQQRYEAPLPSSPFVRHDAAAGIIKTPATTRSNMSVPHNPSLCSGGGGNNNDNSRSTSSVTFTTGQRSATTTALNHQDDSSNSYSDDLVSGGAGVADVSRGYGRTTSRHAVASPDSAAVLSTVLSGYTQCPHRTAHECAEKAAVEEEESEGKSDTHFDGLSRIAAELERAADEDDDYCSNGCDEHVGGAGGSRSGYPYQNPMTNALAETWTPARGLGTPHSLMDSAAARSPYAYTAQPVQQQQPVTPGKSQPCFASSTTSSPVFASTAAATTTTGRKVFNHVDPTLSRTGRSSTANTPFHIIPAAIPRTRQQQQQQHASPSAPTSTDVTLANFLRVNNAAPEVSGESNYYCNVNNSSSTVLYPLGFYEGGGGGDGAAENEAAWRLSVDAELNELQRAGMNTSNNNNNSSSGVHKYGTPTSTISPLAPASTTPYHQLLSQVRYSPQQGNTAPATAAAARANTPPDGRAFSTTQQGVPMLHRAGSDAMRGSVNDLSGLNIGAAAVYNTSGVSRYTANITRVSPYTETSDVGNMTNTASNNSIKGVLPSRGGWPQSSPSPAEAAALWDRMSPYEKAAAAAAAAGTSLSQTALFQTPVTVAKPVTLSSIAAQLHGGNDVTTPDDASCFAHSKGLLPQQQQQYPQRYPSPPAFTTAAAAAVAVMAPSPTSLPHPLSSSARLSDSGLGGGSGVSNPLFPNTQQQQATIMMMPSTAPTGTSGQAHGWTKQHLQQQQQQSVSSAYSQNASPRPTTTMTPSAPAPSRTARPQLSQQQPFPSPSAFPREGSPVEAPTTNTNSMNNNTNNSPPSCSLRPSPQMRSSDGSSPALRRYVITTPNTRANTAGNNNNNYNATGLNSAGRLSNGGSPLGGTYSNNGSPAGANGREARPRVQLSHITGAAALRSPLNTTTTAETTAASSAAGTTPYSTSTSGGGYANAVGGGHPNTQGFTPPYHGHGGNAGGGHSPSTNFNAVLGAGATTSVSPTAVGTLIERLRAVAPLVLSNSTSAASASPAERNSDATAVTAADATSGNKNSSLIPEVASASLILAMSHDQHGCRLLQAVLDAECDGADNDKTTAAANAKEGLYDIQGSVRLNAGREYSPNSSNSISAAERRRQRRADAFYHSTAIQVILRSIEPKLDAVMADGYGNFLLQKVFDMAPDAERQRLLRLPSLQHHLCEVACSPHGTFAVQRLVETVRNTEEERLVFVALERDLLRLLTNANGGHVLMKVMECIRRQYAALTSMASTTSESSTAKAVKDEESSSDKSSNNTAPPLRSLLQDRVDALFTALQQNLLFVCQHKQGCCTVQKCLDFLNACSGLSLNTTAAATSSSHRRKEEGEGSKKDVSNAQQQQLSSPTSDYFERMSALLLPHVHELSVHPFGNYVVTRLVDVCYARGSTATIDAVAAAMQKELVRMCTNKFASNVVEHILRHCSERRIRSICQILMTRAPSGSPPNTAALLVSPSGQLPAVSPTIARLPLTTVVMDSYGNYVIQTLLTVAPVDELASATSVEGGMLPVLQQLLPLLSSRNFGRKLETKTELALLRVEQYQQQQRRRV